MERGRRRFRSWRPEPWHLALAVLLGTCASWGCTSPKTEPAETTPADIADADSDAQPQGPSDADGDAQPADAGHDAQPAPADTGPQPTDAADSGPEPQPDAIAALVGTWTGDLSCYEEGASSSGTATLTLERAGDKATGLITFEGTSPTEFTTTATLELWFDENDALDGAWSNCAIEGGEQERGVRLSCHFWHQVQESGYVFKPNVWRLSEDGATLEIQDAPGVESEAQKCHGDLGKSAG